MRIRPDVGWTKNSMELPAKLCNSVAAVKLLCLTTKIFSPELVSSLSIIHPGFKYVFVVGLLKLAGFQFELIEKAPVNHEETCHNNKGTIHRANDAFNYWPRVMKFPPLQFRFSKTQDSTLVVLVVRWMNLVSTKVFCEVFQVAWALGKLFTLSSHCPIPMTFGCGFSRVSSGVFALWLAWWTFKWSFCRLFLRRQIAFLNGTVGWRLEICAHKPRRDGLRPVRFSNVWWLTSGWGAVNRSAHACTNVRLAAYPHI